MKVREMSSWRKIRSSQVHLMKGILLCLCLCPVSRMKWVNNNRIGSFDTYFLAIYLFLALEITRLVIPHLIKNFCKWKLGKNLNKKRKKLNHPKRKGVKESRKVSKKLRVKLSQRMCRNRWSLKINFSLDNKASNPSKSPTLTH